MGLSSATQIGEIVYRALAFNTQRWRNWQGEMMSAGSLIAAVQRFFTLLAQRQIKYALAGGVALLHYVQGRNTNDLDVVMAATALKKLPELTILQQDNDFVRAMFADLPVDVLLTRNALFRHVYRRYVQPVALLEQTVPIVTVEGLLLLKLYALPSLYRQGNFVRIGLYENDIATLLYYYRPDVTALFQTLSAYITPSDLVEIEAIVTELQRRSQRFGQQ